MMIGAICADFAGSMTTAVGPGNPPGARRQEACTASRRPDGRSQRIATGPVGIPAFWSGSSDGQVARWPQCCDHDRHHHASDFRRIVV
jgi:hypothetical protein